MRLSDISRRKIDAESSEFIRKCIEWDTPRLANEVLPHGVTSITDIPYDPDKGEEGLLDIYFPGDSEDRFDEAFFLIHGGAFVYGNKELDKNYGMHLALRSGLPVINVNYTLMPKTDLAGQSEELCFALSFLNSRYGLTRIHTTGDSAGAYLALLIALLCNDKKIRQDLHVTSDPKAKCLSAGLICGCFIRNKNDFPGLYMYNGGTVPKYILDLSKTCVTSFTENGNIPITIVTGDNDTMLKECTTFKKTLDKAGIPNSFYNASSSEGRTMFHVFPISNPTWPESQKVIDMFADLAKTAKN